jgi:hypothetical protein
MLDNRILNKEKERKGEWKKEERRRKKLNYL